MPDPEERLTGGRVTAGLVRVGDTVRRPLSGDHALQRDLLLHLERRGFPAAPRYLGIDQHGREILSFLPGDVPSELGHFSDQQISAAALLLRSFHDASSDFAMVARRGAETMCHNDWGPPNAVFGDGLPRGMIDFQTLAPGPRLWDLGYSAWSWLDLGNSDYSADEQIRRLILFADSYGFPGCAPEGIAVHALARQVTLAARAKAIGDRGMADWSAASAEWTASQVLARLLLSYPSGA